MIAENEDVCGETNTFGMRGEKAKRCERIPIAAAADCYDIGGNRHVFRTREVVVAKCVGSDCDRSHIVDRGGCFPVGVGPRQHREHRSHDPVGRPPCGFRWSHDAAQ